MTLIAPVVAAIIGALVFALGRGKASEAGRIVFACATLVLLYAYVSHGVKVWP